MSFRWAYLLYVVLTLTSCQNKGTFPSNVEIGDKIDSLNGVYVYYNGSVSNVLGRNVSNDGYNLGLMYQCVEFVKRYYFEHLGHKMPDSYGHAKDFFDTALSDGGYNRKRALTQFSNPGMTRPKMNDIIVYDATIFNMFGHVAIVSSVNKNKVEIIQQNPGPTGKSRETYKLTQVEGKWYIDNHRILGWLRKSH